MMMLLTTKVAVGTIITAACVLSAGAAVASVDTLTQIPVSGTLMFVPAEADLGGAAAEGEAIPNHAPLTTAEAAELGSSAAAESSDGAEGQWMLASDNGAVLPVDPGLAEAEFVPLADFTGSIVLDQQQQVAIESAISAAPPGAATPPSGAAVTPNTSDSEQAALGEAAELDAIAQYAETSGESLSITGTVTPPLAATNSQGVHTADIVQLTTPGVAAANTQTLRASVLAAGKYWEQQTAGSVQGVTVKSVVNISAVGIDTCSQSALWHFAATRMGKETRDYLSGKQHLIVFVQNGSCGALGLGSIGQLAEGGVLWIDTLDPRTGAQRSDLTLTLAHEFGHNFGLGHAQIRSCAGQTIDTDTIAQADEQTLLSVQKPVPPCRDIEYGDSWDVMGFPYSSQPPALSTAQKMVLGVLPENSVVRVRVQPGKQITQTIQAVSATSGVRGIEVQTANHGSFSVEYRNGRGQDSGTKLSSADWYSGLLSSARFGEGVQIVKTYPYAQALWSDGSLRQMLYSRSTVVPQLKNGVKYQTLRAGDRIVPAGGEVAIAVVATTPTTATVKIIPAGFTDVTYGSKFFTEIEWMKSRGLSTGSKQLDGSAAFEAKKSVSREAMAAFLFRYSKARYAAPRVSPFADVSPSDPFYTEISWMYSQGISRGIAQRTGKPLFKPKASVSREAMAAFLYRFAGAHLSGPVRTPFTDVSSRAPFAREISWMSVTGLSTGTHSASGGKAYLPKSSVSREAMAAFLYRYDRRS